MLVILLIFLLTAASLALFFWLGGLFLQGYLYTQPSEKLYWQAPATAVLLAAYIALWCTLILRSSEATPTNLPYDTLFRFSPREDMVPEPIKEIKAVMRTGPPVVYKVKRRNQTQYYYLTAQSQKPWDHSAEAVLLEHNGEEMRFDAIAPDRGENRRFVSAKGWTLVEFDDGPSGVPTIFRTGRMLANLFLNFTLLAVCIVSMWLLMRFLFSHALLIGIVLWATLTLVILPMFFSYAGEASRQRRRGITPPPHAAGRVLEPRGLSAT